MNKIFIAACILMTNYLNAQTQKDSTPTVRTMEEVQVIALRGTAITPFTKQKLLASDLSKSNLGQDIPFLLNQTPNVVINSDAGNGVGYTGIRIRGTDATRINMTINGVPYNDAESQGLFLVNLPDLVSSVNSIEIQRGVGSSSNGAGAFGATMSFSTSNPNNKPYLEFNNSFGSFNTIKNTLKFGTVSNNKFYFDGRISSINSDGYIARAGTKLKSGLITFGYKNQKTDAKLNIILGKEKTYQAWYGVSQAKLKADRRFNAAGTEKTDHPYDNETDNYWQNHYQFIINHSANKNWNLSTTSFYTRGKGYYEQYKTGAFYNSYGLPDFNNNGIINTTTDLVRQLWLNNHFYGQTFAAIYNKGLHNLTLGGMLSKYDGQHFGQIPWAMRGIAKNHKWYDLNSVKTDHSLYGKWQYKFDVNTFLYSDIQLRQAGYATTGFRNNPSLSIDKKFNFINPKFGVTHFIPQSNSTLTASFAKGSKEPNREDFEASTATVPSPEKLQDWELNYKRNLKKAHIQATVYYMKYIDQLILTGKINDVGAYTRQNVANSYRLGLEINATAIVTNKWNILGSLSLSKNKIKAFTEYIDDYDNGGQIAINHSKTNIAFSPNLVLNMTNTIKPNKNLEINLLSKYVGRQYLDNTQNKSRALKGYFSQDINLGYDLKMKKIKGAKLIVQVNNITNMLYEPNGYTFSYFLNNTTNTENFYFPMAGVNYMVGLNLTIF